MYVTFEWPWNEKAVDSCWQRVEKGNGEGKG